MINKERLEQAINIMKRAGAVDMTSWQGGAFDECATTETELHSCGNTACFAGWLTISPEFLNSGGWVSPKTGAPAFGGRLGAPAVIGWLEAKGLKAELLNLLITNSAVISASTEDWLYGKNIQVEVGRRESGYEYSHAHLIHWRDYNAQDVIEFLEILRD